MPPVRVAAKLDFIHRHEIRADLQRHRLDRTDPISGAVRYDAFFAGHQRHDRRSALCHDPVIDFTRQQAQRQADHPGAMRQHPFDGKMGLAGVRRSENRRDPRGRIHDRSLQVLPDRGFFQPRHSVLYVRQMRIDSQGHTIDLQRLFGSVQLLEDHAQSRQCREMARV